MQIILQCITILSQLNYNIKITQKIPSDGHYSLLAIA